MLGSHLMLINYWSEYSYQQ